MTESTSQDEHDNQPVQDLHCQVDVNCLMFTAQEWFAVVDRNCLAGLSKHCKRLILYGDFLHSWKSPRDQLNWSAISKRLIKLDELVCKTNSNCLLEIFSCVEKWRFSAVWGSSSMYWSTSICVQRLHHGCLQCFLTGFARCHVLSK